MIPTQVWGANDAELAVELPCDDELSGKVTVVDRVVPVAAPPELLYAWLCQLRVATFSYPLLDAGSKHCHPPHDPALTDLAAGQQLMFVFDLISWRPGRDLTMRATAGGVDVAATYAAHPDGNGSRLHARACFGGPTWKTTPMVLADFVMMRKQLQRLKACAEAETEG